MKKLKLKLVAFVAVGLLALMSAPVFAGSGYSYLITRSTAVCISTATQGELLSVSHSSASSVYGDSYWVAYDSNPLQVALTGVTGRNNVPQMTFDMALFTDAKLIQPPTVMFTSATIAGIAPFNTPGGSYNKVDLTNGRGQGRGFSDGLVIFKVGANVLGTYMIVEYRHGTREDTYGKIPTNGVVVTKLPAEDTYEILSVDALSHPELVSLAQNYEQK